jgi:hypothetical protein
MSNTIKINALKSKIEKLKKGMSAKAATETAKSKAKILIGKYEREIESLKEKPKKRGTKSAKTSVAKARLLAAKRRAMQGLSTSKSDIEKDAQRPALPAGKRISKDGNTYFEYRENRIDRRPKKYARLEDGGEMMAKGGVIEEGDMVLVKSEGLEAEVIRITKDNVVVEFINRRPDGGDKRGNYKLSQLKKMADGGMMAKGAISESDIYYGVVDSNNKLVFQSKSEREAKLVSNSYEGSVVKKYKGKAKIYEYADGGMMADGGEIKTGDYVYVISYDAEKPNFFGEVIEYGVRTSKVEDENGDIQVVLNSQIQKEEYAFGGRTKSGLMRDRAYKSQQPYEQAYKRKTNPKNPKYNKYSDGGEMHKTEMNEYGLGGEISENGFYYNELNKKLLNEFPDSFGLTIYNLNPDFSYARLLGVDYDGGFYGIGDQLSEKKLYFPKYKRDHEIEYRISQSDENTSFYFKIMDEDGNYYVGYFGFKDRGDVPSSYVTRFIAFLMEAYGLPFQIKHEVE